MKSFAFAAAAAFFLVSPGFACGPAEPEYHYGAAEMRAVVEGDWDVTITPPGGATLEYMVHLQQATKAPASAARETHRGLIRAAHACGSRTLVASASACIDVTVMPLDVTLAPGGSALTGTPTGDFRIMSTVFGRGTLALAFDDWNVSADIEPDGTVVSMTATARSGAKAAATLTQL
jgi:hypothetical protein